MPPPSNMKILMLGPDLSVKGGVSSVEKIMINNYSGNTILTHLPTMHDRTIIGRLRHWFARLLSIPFRLINNKPDLIHIHFSHSLSTLRKLILLRCWKFFGVPVVLHAHSSDYKEYFPSLPKLARWWVSNSIKKANHLIVLSASWKKFYSDIIGINPDKITIMMNPIEFPENFDTNIADNLVLFSGRIGDRKGTFDLINAGSLLPNNITSNFSLMLTGDGQINEAKRLVNNLNLSDSVNVAGWVDIDTLKKALSSCCIYILPSFNEGLPMGLLEAMAHGKPPITTPVGGIPELVQDNKNGLLVNPGDVKQISEALKKLLENENLRSSMGLNARESVEHLDIVRYMEKMNSLWAKIIL